MEESAITKSEAVAGESFQFKTNINCSGCIAKVTPALNEAQGIAHWGVNTNSKEKILTVQSGGITKEQVMEVVKKSGFQITAIG